MSPYAITCIVVFTAAALIHAKGARPLWLYGLTGLAFLATGIVMDLLPTLLSQAPDTVRPVPTDQSGPLQGAYPLGDRFSLARFVGILLLAVTALPALQQMLGAMYLPRLTRWLFWPLAGGLALAPLVQTLTLGQIPRRYTQVPDRFSTAHTLEVTLAYIIYAAGILLLALFLGSLLWRLKTALRPAK